MGARVVDDQPQQFGRYRVVRVLGSGAMGTVFEAVDDLLGRRVAVKTVLAKGRAAELLPKRFLNEAKAVAAVSHPNIVPIYDLGFEGTTPFIVMELVRGPTLKSRIEAAPLSPEDVRALGTQLAQALETAHAAGIVHRDVKPANVLEAAPGLWKLADFGVAHVPDSSLTMTGQFVGSVAYAPPEALVLGQLGPPADVYGLAATLYEAACGVRPYADAADGNLGELLSRPPPPSPSARVPGFPPGLSAAILAALAAEPGKRPTAAELVKALAPRAPTDTSEATTPLRATPTSARRRSRAPLLIALLAVAGSAGGVAWLVTRPSRAPVAIPVDAAVAEVAVDAAIADASPDAPPPAPTSDVAELAPLREAVLAGRGASAIRGLLALRKEHPKVAEIPYLLGLAYYSKRVDAEALRMLQAAIALEPAYKTDERLIKTTLQYGLQTNTYPWKVVSFLKTSVGRAAVPYLEDFAKDHPNARVRGYAKTALGSF